MSVNWCSATFLHVRNCGCQVDLQACIAKFSLLSFRRKLHQKMLPRLQSSICRVLCNGGLHSTPKPQVSLISKDRQWYDLAKVCCDGFFKARSVADKSNRTVSSPVTPIGHFHWPSVLYKQHVFLFPGDHRKLWKYNFIELDLWVDGFQSRLSFL